MMLACYIFRALQFGDMHQDCKMTFRSRLSLEMVEELVDDESLVREVFLHPDYYAFQAERSSLRIDNFEND